MSRLWLGLGAAYGFLAVAAGVYGAHVAKAQLGAELLATYRTANEYQFVHALALFGTGVLALVRPGRAVNIAGAAFALAVPLFCGSLYAFALGGEATLKAAAPFGGTLMLAGWAALVASALGKPAAVTARG